MLNCTLVKWRLYLYNLGHTAASFCGDSQMENVKEFTYVKQQYKSNVNEAENLEIFILIADLKVSHLKSALNKSLIIRREIRW